MYIPYTVPISVKGVVWENNQVWLRKNERGEWELPGGKLELGEQPEDTVVRELDEELGLKVTVEDILGAFLYKIKVSQDESRGVLVVSYKCVVEDRVGDFELIGEAGKAGFRAFALSEVESLSMPDFYKKAIRKSVL